MRVFLDTNVLVYANDEKDARKHRIAKDTVVRALGENEGVISTQVLGEFASVALTKLSQSAAMVMTQTVLFERFQIVPITPALIRRAIEIRETSRVNYWGGQIIAAAEHGGCDVILSEDLNGGQRYGGVRVENPFG